MAKRKKKSSAKPLILTFVFLTLAFILLLLLYFHSTSSLFLLSETTIRNIDKSLEQISDSDIMLHIEQVNYYNKKPYKYVYKRIKWNKSIGQLKRQWSQSLKRIPFVQIQYWKEENRGSETEYLVKIGTRNLVFYQLNLIASKKTSVYEEINTNKALPEKQKVVEENTIYQEQKPKAKIAIVIDDVGAEPLSLTKQFLKFPEKVTFAIFPLLDTSKDRAERIHKHSNFSIIIHQPMEPIHYKERHIRLQAGVLLTNMSQQEIIQTLQKSIKSVPYALGMNNHQGSAGTSSKRMMDIVLKYLKTRNFFFLDSYTIASSVGYKEARRIGIPCSKRDVFLDNINTEEAVQKQLNKLVKLALKKGQAVGIGHMTKRATINVLLKNLNKIKKQNIEFVFVKDILHTKPLVQ